MGGGEAQLHFLISALDKGRGRLHTSPTVPAWKNPQVLIEWGAGWAEQQVYVLVERKV
jgi:hypothetical protein